MLWQGKGSRLELEPTSRQKSFCSSQLGQSRRHSPTPGSLRGHRAVSWDGGPVQTGMTTPQPPSHPELLEAQLCLFWPQNEPAALGETQTMNSEMPGCSRG